MFLQRLEVQGLRILQSVQLAPSARLNLLTGENGAGKTSVLEAVHILGTGRSFRVRDVGRLVGWSAEALRVFGEVAREGRDPVRLGVLRGLDGTTRVRVGGEDRRGFAAAARELPLAVFSPESQDLVIGPPERRRALMDWALFHVEPSYGESLQRYRRALRQRNLALRDRLGRSEVQAWEPQLVREGERLHACRQTYFQDVAPRIVQALSSLRNLPLDLLYHRGWSADVSLQAAMHGNWSMDSARGWTSAGPHAAELLFQVRGHPARDVLSRGETRSLVAAITLAHVAYLGAATSRQPIVLADDIPSELDGPTRAWFLRALLALGSQLFVTAVDPDLLTIPPRAEHRVFHVKQGVLTTLV